MALRLFRESLEVVLATAMAGLFVQTFLFRAFVVPSDSMEPSLVHGDHLLVNRFIHRSSGVLPWQRGVAGGDVVVFRFPAERSKVLIKRCVAVAGDTVEIRDKDLLVNGREAFGIRSVFRDPHTYPRSRFLEPPLRDRDNFGPLTVPEGEIFVLGDNRDTSFDSRFWGTVPVDQVLGSARLIYWSRRPEDPGSRPAVRWRRIGQSVR